MSHVLRTAAIVAMVMFQSGLAVGTPLIEPVQLFVSRVQASLESLPEHRQELLNGVADYIAARVGKGEEARLVFICTHNSRRSQLAQVWCQVAAGHYAVPGVRAESGGTETTACNIRTVRALRRAGLSAVATTGDANPVYLIQYADNVPPVRAYSKVYSASGLPTSGFAALMCCSDADERCPLVTGADGRFALHYEDPKVADDRADETARYDERNFQIAREMFYVMSRVASQLRE